MKGEEKHKSSNSTTLSKGILSLILIILAAQFGYFIYYVVRDLRSGQPAVAELVDKDTIQQSKKPVDIKTDLPVATHTGPSDKVTSVQKPKRQSTDTVAKTIPDSGTVSYTYDGWKWDMVELNSADSATLDHLPGIGPYYAGQILRYREKLWGRYHDIHQLMEIRGIDTVLFARIEHRIYIDPETIIIRELDSISSDSLDTHPYIGPFMAKGIERLRNMTPEGKFCIQSLIDNRIIRENQARRLALYFK